eukprot:1246328-Pyramimonas_sp.AAC.2
MSSRCPPSFMTECMHGYTLCQLRSSPRMWRSPPRPRPCCRVGWMDGMPSGGGEGPWKETRAPALVIGKLI